MLQPIPMTDNSAGKTGHRVGRTGAPGVMTGSCIARALWRAHSCGMESKAIRTPQVVLLALAIGLFFTAQASLMSLAADRRIIVQKDIAPELLYWTVWALLSPLLLAAARRWPLDTRPSNRPILAHLACCLVLAVIQSAIAFGLRPTLWWATGFFTTAEIPAWIARRASSMVWGLFMSVMFYVVIVGIYSVLRYRALYAAEQMSAAELSRRGASLEAELARAKLDALRSQLRPHFLFNTLNAISVLSQRDADKARQMLLRLSSLLRRSLEEDAHEVALCQELQFLNEYLDIMRVRLGERLDVRVAVDPDALEARVPVFLLQPLVENAIEHGEGDDGRTVISVTASCAGDHLVVVIENAGTPHGNGAPPREGIGLGNTRARLRELYGERAHVQLAAANMESRSPAARLELVLPFVTAATIA